MHPSWFPRHVLVQWRQLRHLMCTSPYGVHSSIRYAQRPVAHISNFIGMMPRHHVEYICCNFTYLCDFLWHQMSSKNDLEYALRWPLCPSPCAAIEASQASVAHTSICYAHQLVSTPCTSAMVPVCGAPIKHAPRHTTCTPASIFHRGARFFTEAPVGTTSSMPEQPRPCQPQRQQHRNHMSCLESEAASFWS